MPQCLHPIEIRHPTYLKWCREMYEKGIYPEGTKLEEDFLKLHHIEKKMKIPCGKCLYCYQRKQEVWRIRLQQEMKDSFSTFFVTLTYDDEHLPRDGVSKSDFQKFMKRFRHYMAIPLRYFAVSEYGPNGTHRPHYHFALFFKDFVDFEDVLLELEMSWPCIVNLQDLTDGRIHYLSTYCIKFFNDAPTGKNSNFMLCSRRPFIGSSFLTSEMSSNMRKKLVPFLTVNGFKKPIPQIYKSRLFDDEMVIQLREKQISHEEELKQNLISSYGDLTEANKVLRYQAKLDYRSAWRKFKESKKL